MHPSRANHVIHQKTKSNEQLTGLVKPHSSSLEYVGISVKSRHVRRRSHAFLGSTVRGHSDSEEVG